MATATSGSGSGGGGGGGGPVDDAAKAVGVEGGEAPASAASLMLNQPVVIDNGSSSIKAGFAGSSKPKVVVGTRVGRTKHMRIMPGGALEASDGAAEGGGGGSGSRAASARGVSSSIFVGDKLDEHRGAFLLEHPMDNGAVVDTGWDAMERLWEHVYSKQCLNAKQDEHPVLITEIPLNPYKNRERMAEVFFESFNVPALYFTPPSVLSLYASGRTTGIVLDVGDTVSHAVPVYEGFALQHSVVRSDIAGRDVTRQLQLHLRKNLGLTLTTTAEVDYVRTMKEEVCFLPPTSTAGAGGTGGDTDAASAAAADTLLKDSKTQYQLPDGQVVTLSSERYTAPGVLFDPSTAIGSEEPGVADVLVNSIMKSDLELRQKLFSQIVLAGGTTMLPGFGDRLLFEVRTKCPTNTRIRISAPQDRLYSSYVGGSILASLATFKSMWVSRQEYEENGPSRMLLHRKEL